MKKMHLKQTTQDKNIIEVFEAENRLLDRIKVTAEQPLYGYQIDIMGRCIVKPELCNHLGVTLQDSVNNMKVLDAWRNQVRLSCKLYQAKVEIS